MGEKDPKMVDPMPKVSMTCLVRRNSDGKIRCDMPDGTTRYVTDEEWPEVKRLQREHAQRKAIAAERAALRARLAELEAMDSGG